MDRETATPISADSGIVHIERLSHSRKQAFAVLLHRQDCAIPDVARVVAPLWKRTVAVQKDEFSQSSAAIDGQALAEFMNGDAARGLTADAVGAAPVT